MGIHASRTEQGLAGPADWTTQGADHFPRDRHFDLKHLKLDLSFDERKRSVRGTATHTLSPLHDGLKAVTLDAVDLAIHSVKVDGRKASFETHGGQIDIALARKHAAGKPITIEIAYEARPQLGLYFIGPDKGHPRKPRQIWSQGEMEENRHWFPCYDAPDDKCTSEVVLTVDERYIAVSNGRLVKTTRDRRRGTATFHWLQDIPHVTYLVSIAVGRFDVARERFGSVPVEYYVPKGKGNLIRSTFGRTVDMMRFFSDRIGLRYPYDKYSQVIVCDFTFGGMENTSMTIETDRCLVPARLLAETDSDGLVAHELAHQWWGDLVTTKSWAHIWLNEGFASYFDPLYCEHAKGVDEFRKGMAQTARGILDEDALYRRPIVTHRWVSAEDMFDRHSYNKGAWVLHMLRGYLGDDLFWKGIRRYIQLHARKNVETSDFKVAMEEATGRSLDFFFQQWLYRAGHPAYEVSHQWDAAGYLRLTIKQTQKVDAVTPLFRMPVEVAVATDAGGADFRIDVSKTEETFVLGVPRRPRAVYFDPKGWILKTVKFQRGMDELVWQLSRAPVALCRAEAAAELGKQPRAPKVYGALERALSSDRFYGVRQAAADALASVGGEEAARILAGNLRARDARVRRSIAAALGKLKAPWVESALLKAARDRSDLVRAAAVGAIAQAKSRKAFPALLRALRQESWNDCVRASALAGFGKLGDAQGVPLCRKYAAYGHSQQARNNAISSLVEFWRKSPDRRDEICELVLEAVKDREYWVRRFAMEESVKMDDPRVRPALEAAAASDIHMGARRSARMALMKLDRGRKGDADAEAMRKELSEVKETARRLEGKVAEMEARLPRKAASAR